MSVSHDTKVTDAIEEYWCFISYRHSDNKKQDRDWASWLHQEIERYEVPADLVGTKNQRGDKIPERIYPVFRDEESLPADADLAKSIEIALDRSKFLAVLCSPRAVESEYVAQEIKHFVNSRGDNRIIAAILDGEPGDPERECFPVPLRNLVTDDGRVREPIAADFRLNDGTEGFTSVEAYRLSLKGSPKKLAQKLADEYESRLQLMKLKVIAGILGLPLEQLRNRDKAFQLELARKRSQRLKLWLSAVAAALVLALVGGWVAMVQKQRAETARSAADKVLNVILYDLSNELKQQGLYRLYSRVSNEAEAYFQSFPESRKRSGESLEVQARALLNSAEAGIGLGNYGLAKREAKAAIQVARSLVENSPGNSDFAYLLSSALQFYGSSCQEQGDYDLALESFEESLVIAEQLYESEPDGDHLRLLAVSLQFRGDVERYLSDDMTQAISYFTRLSELAKKGVQEGELESVTIPDIEIFLRSKAKLGTALYQAGRFEEALQHYRARKEFTIDYHEGMNTSSTRHELGWSALQLGRMLWAMKDYPQAEFETKQSVEIFEQLFVSEPIYRNVEPYSEALLLLAKIQFLNHGLSVAGPTWEKNLEIAGEGYRLSPTSESQFRLAKAHQVLGQMMVGIPDFDNARKALQNALNLVRELHHSDQKPEYLKVFAECLHLTGYMDREEGRDSLALEMYEQAYTSATEIQRVTDGKMGALLLAEICCDLAEQHLMSSDVDAALPLFAECFELYDLIVDDDPAEKELKKIAGASYEYMRLKGEKDPENLSEQVELGERAARYFSVLEKLYPSVDNHWYLRELNKSLGIRCRNLGRTDDAIAAFTEVLKWCGDSPEQLEERVPALVELASLSAKREGAGAELPYWEEAATLLKQVFKSKADPEVAARIGFLHRGIAFLFLNRVENQKAKHHFEQAFEYLELGGNDQTAEEVRFDLAVATALVEEGNQNLRGLRAAFEKDPGDLSSFLHLRHLLQENLPDLEDRNDWPAAENLMAEICALWKKAEAEENPVFGFAAAAGQYLNDVITLSHYQILNQQFKEAEATLTSRREDGESSDLLLNLAHAFLFQGRVSEALETYLSYLSSGSDREYRVKIISADFELYEKTGLSKSLMESAREKLGL